ncbi:MAG: DUF455 family protein [Leptospiraceae bacterium]|nr:DUF455 family protein [Leptospiraceae bacterium]
MKSINEFALHILQSESLESKLEPPPKELTDTLLEVDIPKLPNREKKISFSDVKSKIPRLEHLHIPENRAIAMHHFANHELQAIELFAWALLKFQDIPTENRLDLFKTLKEEQNHLKLYLARIRELGLDFGDRPLNQIFWKFTPLMYSFPKFSAILSISLEGANLDFSLLYTHVFEKFKDDVSSKIMRKIFQDELKHVKRGVKVLKSIESGNNDWEKFLSLLEFPFTPRRAKGFYFFPHTRKKVCLDNDFIENLSLYRDEFSKRKKETIPGELLQWGIYSG